MFSWSTLNVVKTAFEKFFKIAGNSAGILTLAIVLD